MTTWVACLLARAIGTALIALIASAYTFGLDTGFAPTVAVYHSHLNGGIAVGDCETFNVGIEAYGPSNVLTVKLPIGPALTFYAPRPYINEC